MNNDRQPIYAKGLTFFAIKKISQHDILPYRSMIALNPLDGGTLTLDPETKPKTPDGDAS